ncbi:hypothetical protein EGR_07747 [Echinococcus granulosus]|uniref:Uncharacterized protein n=1 Tax=Echinococcus granulosus TaxID=6210 RepID=W6U861_ECHGR|nr:hypothetical protein EGR_07747 [Echinococcus granulosus]EUB57423.1 hypothetical protein EGR_07747 [Echinococcus granulosus]
MMHIYVPLRSGFCSHLWRGYAIPLLIASLSIIGVFAVLLVSLSLLLCTYRKGEPKFAGGSCIGEDSLLYMEGNPLSSSPAKSDDDEDVLFDKIRDVFIPKFFRVDTVSAPSLNPPQIQSTDKYSIFVPLFFPYFMLTFVTARPLCLLDRVAFTLLIDFLALTESSHAPRPHLMHRHSHNSVASITTKLAMILTITKPFFVLSVLWLISVKENPNIQNCDRQIHEAGLAEIQKALLAGQQVISHRQTEVEGGTVEEPKSIMGQL